MPISVAELCEAATPLFDVSRRDMIDPSRMQHIFRARAAVCLAASIAGRSYAEIGQALGGRSKATIFNAVERAEAMAKREPGYKAACDHLVGLANEWTAKHAQISLTRVTVHSIKRGGRAPSPITADRRQLSLAI
ncbi:MAG: hypothetical protein EON58_15860 [Alphaproteobacteria bacterium]|nr:MAG: hypothetical protein EON58_15860 [Alphaproteobacteria bacterium]